MENHMNFEYFSVTPFHSWDLYIITYNCLAPETSMKKWLFQLDESKFLHGKWLFQQTSTKNWLFGDPGGWNFLWNIEYIDVTIHGTENMDPKKVYFFVWFSLDHWIHMDE